MFLAEMSETGNFRVAEITKLTKTKLYDFQNCQNGSFCRYEHSPNSISRKI